MEALVRQKYLVQLQGIHDFTETAKRLYLDEADLLEETLSDLILVMELAFPLNLSVSLTIWFNVLKTFGRKERLSALVCPRTKLVRRVVLTPTRLLLYPKELAIENRILRNFNPDFALRVSFRDDDFVKLNIRQASVSVNISTIVTPMTEGLNIAGRTYEFLGWSNSQLKDHSVWMYAKDEKNNTSETIRQWSGDFSEIKIVARYMARMGQCFTQTTETVSFSFTDQQVELETDIKRGVDFENSKPFCFSNGIGRINEETVEEVCQILDLKRKPSAFQIRYGGIKGMVVTDPTLKDKRIVFRESMQKFKSSSNRLEIVKVSTPSMVALNRPLIVILEERGIAPEAFLRIQEDTFETLTELLLNSEKATTYLASKNNLHGVDLTDAYNCGIDLVSEPFFRKLLLARHHRDIDILRWKTRLPIDPSEGRNMFGVLDETATLLYGQVFVQYTTDFLVQERTGDTTRKTSSKTTILKGKVLVTKNPCYLPGDVRIFECVDVPALHHIVDCIVFPQLGQRPHPNELSGSDLDGDEYTVIWKKALLFKTNASPGTFPSRRGPTVSHPINVMDMVAFLRRFINHDNIGFLASCHLASCDNYGVHSSESIELARMCSIAVDFPKTGWAVYPMGIHNPEAYPDFMERSYKESYRSKRVLGKLYRVCRDFQEATKVVSYSYERVKVDEDLVFQGWEEYKAEAESTLASYQNSMLQLLGTFGIKHESEVLSSAFSTIHSRFKETKDRYETEEIVSIYVRALWKKYKNEFWKELNLNELEYDLDSSVEDVKKKVSAYYVVTYSQYKPVVLGLPWIFTRQLAQIKQQKLSERNQPLKLLVSPLLQKLNWEVHKIRLSDLDSLASVDLIQASVFSGNNYYTLRAANAVILHWAREVALLYRPDACPPRTGFMDRTSVMRLFLHVARREIRDDGVMPLVLVFFRFCISLRFLNYSQKKERLPFHVPQSGYLSKMAMMTYRNLAVSANLLCLNIGGNSIDELFEMEPIRVQEKCIDNNPVRFRTLLTSWSGVEYISVRKDRREQYVINALGRAKNIRNLESILRRGDQDLKTAITTGVLHKKGNRTDVV